MSPAPLRSAGAACYAQGRAEPKGVSALLRGSWRDLDQGSAGVLIDEIRPGIEKPKEGMSLAIIVYPGSNGERIYAYEWNYPSVAVRCANAGGSTGRKP